MGGDLFVREALEPGLDPGVVTVVDEARQVRPQELPGEVGIACRNRVVDGAVDVTATGVPGGRAAVQLRLMGSDRRSSERSI